MPPAARIIYWALIVTSAGCFGYSVYILMAWPAPFRDSRLEGFMAEITVNRVAAFTLAFAGAVFGFMVWLLHFAS